MYVSVFFGFASSGLCMCLWHYVCGRLDGGIGVVWVVLLDYMFSWLVWIACLLVAVGTMVMCIVYNLLFYVWCWFVCGHELCAVLLWAPVFVWGCKGFARLSNLCGCLFGLLLRRRFANWEMVGCCFAGVQGCIVPTLGVGVMHWCFVCMREIFTSYCLSADCGFVLQFGVCGAQELIVSSWLPSMLLRGRNTGVPLWYALCFLVLVFWRRV